MSSVISLLESLGQDAELRHANTEELESALIRAGIDSAARSAILAGDKTRLESVLACVSNVCCGVFPGKEEEEEEEEPSKEDEEIRAQRHAA